MDKAEVNRLIAGGTLTGQSRQTLIELKKLTRLAASKDGLIVAGSKTFQPDDYAELVFQTKLAEATNIATVQRLQDRKIFYVKVIGSNSRNFCTAFVGRVFYTGDGADPLGLFPNIRELPRGGAPFHPRCTKRYVAFIPRLATPEQIEDAKIRPHERELLNKSPAVAQAALKPAAVEPPPPAVVASLLPAAAPVRSFPPAVQAEAVRAVATYTPDEAASVRTYQSAGPKKNAGYADVNAWHRFAASPVRGRGWVDRVTSGLDAAIEKGTLPQPVTTHRAIRGTDALVDDWRLALDTGIPWTEQGFFSTSATADVAPEFWGKSKRKVLFTVTVPAGTRAAFPAATTGIMPEQLELILSRGSKFDLLSIEDRDGVTVVTARLAS